MQISQRFNLEATQLAVWAQHHGHDSFRAVMLGIAGMLAVASTAFRVLPRSPLLSERGGA